MPGLQCLVAVGQVKARQDVGNQRGKGPAVHLGLGDFGMAVNAATGAASGCVFADVGPRGHVGEGSIALAEALGIPSNPRRGGVGNGILYVVFAGSAAGWPLDRNAVESNASKLFEAWGGMAMLRAVMPEYC